MEHTCFLLMLILAFHRSPAVVAMSPLFNNLFLPQCVCSAVWNILCTYVTCSSGTPFPKTACLEDALYECEGHQS